MARSNQSGLALLTVLLTLTVAILLAAGLSKSLQRQVQVAQGLQSREQGWQYVLSAEQQALKSLLQDFKDDKDIIHLGQPWAAAGRAFPVDRGTITGQLFDMQACLNLNALAQDDTAGEKGGVKRTPYGVNILSSLLKSKEIDDYLAEGIAQATRDWVYPKTAPVAASGADDDDYLSLPVPYLAGNTGMRDKSEWRAVKGVSARIASEILPYLCAIPETSLQININTLPAKQPELLAALLLNRIGVPQAKEVLEQRPGDGWSDVDEFFQLSVVAAAANGDFKDDLKKMLQVNSG
ncbi:MAG: type II secretion system minor pseudopilin GspK, partial [Desulfovibrionales bacterium]|nr:type II secretion system minor pseudopilin GspK [Desulfovibrionales bacterium]